MSEAEERAAQERFQRMGAAKAFRDMADAIERGEIAGGRVDYRGGKDVEMAVYPLWWEPGVAIPLKFIPPPG